MKSNIAFLVSKNESMSVLWQSVRLETAEPVQDSKCLQGTNTKNLSGKYVVFLNMMPNLYLLIFGMFSQEHGCVLSVI